AVASLTPPAAISDAATRPANGLRPTMHLPPKISSRHQPAATWRTSKSYARLDPNYGTRAERRREVRKVPASPARFEFDAFAVALDQRTLYRLGEPVQLPSRAFDTLVYLIENRDRCIRKDELVEAIWHDVVVTDDSLIHAISVLRRALGDERHQPKFIRTVPRRGYRFIAEVRATPAGAPAQDFRPEDGAAAQDSTRAYDQLAETPSIAASAARLGRRRWLAAGVSVAAAAAALVWL